MSFSVFPHEILPSAYIIDYDRLYSEGYRGVIFDVDNTLVPHGASADLRSKALFSHLHEIGMKTTLVSNNREERVSIIAGQLETEYVYLAGKPSPRGFCEAMAKMGTDADSTFSVGDQIFTDVIGSRAAGLRTIMVKPIHPREEVQIIVKRVLEKPILAIFGIMRFVGVRSSYPSAALKETDGHLVSPYGEYDGRSGSLHNMQ